MKIPVAHSFTLSWKRASQSSMSIRSVLDRLRDRNVPSADEDDAEVHPIRSRFLKAWLGILHADDSHPLLRPKKRFLCDVIVYVSIEQ
jgi:hypothetical protein